MTAASEDRQQMSNRVQRRLCLILGAICLVSVVMYLVMSAGTYRLGFPLDDAWIHQTYARNLALRGEWSFIPGQASGGSTAPLWSALLALGFLVKAAPFWWAYLLGGAALFGLSLLAEITIRKTVPTYSPKFPWVGTVMALEWHLVWASVSGMETLLYALLVLLVLVLVIGGSRRYFIQGLLIGLSVWIRPDGITLLGPALLVLVLTTPGWRRKARALLNLGIGVGTLFAFYLLFNLVITGSPWPNTFYAKQAEYAVYMQTAFLSRLGQEALQPLIGAGAVLLIGVVLAIVAAIRKRQWGIVAAAAWLVGFLMLYAWKLPVTYQHGRYVIPAMPIFFLLGLNGIAQTGIQAGQRIRSLLLTAWKVSAALLLLLFWGRGAYAYAQDVAIINSEMVATADWVAMNVPAGDLLAAHDIGALGYFGKHDLVDMAGLVTPQVIPFLRDEAKLGEYLTQRNVTYLVTFPDWYPELTQGLECVFKTDAAFAPAYGQTNMAVYRWPAP